MRLSIPAEEIKIMTPAASPMRNNTKSAELQSSAPQRFYSLTSSRQPRRKLLHFACHQRAAERL